MTINITDLIPLAASTLGGYTAAQLLSRTNHTGTQSYTTITGLGSLATLNTINNSNWLGTDLTVQNGGTGRGTLQINNFLRGNTTGAIKDDISFQTGTLSSSTSAVPSAATVYNAIAAIINWRHHVTVPATGSSVEVTGIPATTTGIRIIFDAVTMGSSNGDVRIKLGSSTAWSGFSYGGSMGINGSGSTDFQPWASGFGYLTDRIDASVGIHGFVDFYKFNGSTRWSGGGNTSHGTNEVTFVSGTITCPSTINRLQFTPATGNFSSGNIQIFIL